MKINEFTKADQFLMYINELEISGNLFSLAEYGDTAIKYGIATTKKGLSSILSKLKKNGLIENKLYVDPFDNYLYCWRMTYPGQNYVHGLMLKLDPNSWFEVQPKENKIIEQPKNFENNDTQKFVDAAQKYATMANDIASTVLKQYGVNTDTDEIAKLQEENDELKYDLHNANEAYKYIEEKRDALADELNAAKETIGNLRKTLQNVYAQLDKKTKECEKLQFGFDKLKTTCQNLTVWIDNIKTGQGI